MGRKTFKIRDYQDNINERLANPEIAQDVKAGLCVELESMLMTTGNYAGFAFDSNEESDTFVTYDRESDTFTYGPKRFDRFYFIHQDLQ